MSGESHPPRGLSSSTGAGGAGSAVAGGVPAPLVFAASAFSQYLGADLAVSLFSLMPATSILVGAVVLGQLPSGWKVAGLVLVSVAVAQAGADGRAGQGNGSQSAVEARRSPESGCAQHVRTRMPQNVSVHGGDADEVAIRIGNHEGSAKDIVVGFFNNCDAFCCPFLVDGIHRLQ